MRVDESGDLVHVSVQKHVLHENCQLALRAVGPAPLGPACLQVPDRWLCCARKLVHGNGRATQPLWQDPAPCRGRAAPRGLSERGAGLGERVTNGPPLFEQGCDRLPSHGAAREQPR